MKPRLKIIGSCSLLAWGIFCFSTFGWVLGSVLFIGLPLFAFGLLLVALLFLDWLDPEENLEEKE